MRHPVHMVKYNQKEESVGVLRGIKAKHVGRSTL